MKVKYNNIRNLLKRKQFSFKNKIELTSQNFGIKKLQNHFELSLVNINDTNLDKKVFLFNNDTTLEKILKNLENEYNLQFGIKESDKELFSKILQNINNKKAEIDVLETLYTDIEKLMNDSKLNASGAGYEEYKNLLNKLDNYHKEEISNMQKEYFMICAELNDSAKTLDLIDKKIKFRTKFVFAIITLLFSFITGLFFYGIYMVDDLGWDIVEPTTFLFSSIIFIGCFYGYLRLQRKGLYSSGLLLSDLKESLMRKFFVKYNFNEKRFNELKILKEQLYNKIERI